MSAHDKPQNGPASDPDAWVGPLLEDAVRDVEPGDRLDAIRSATAVTPLASRRAWYYGAAGALVAAAATITAIAVLGPSGDDVSAPDPATSPSVVLEDPTTLAPEPTPTQPTPSASEPAPADPGPTGPAVTSVPTTVPVYYLGDGPRGPVLFREFHRVQVEAPADRKSGRLEAALREAVAVDPKDPDYRSAWPQGTGIGATSDSDITDEVITVRLVSGRTSLRARPAGMSPEEADLSVQQLVYSAQAAVGQGRTPVQVLLDGERTDTVLGVPTAEPLAEADPIEVLSLMNISSPDEGEQVEGVFTATGVSSGFEAHVGWQVIDAGGNVVVEGFGTAEGWMDKLYPWQVEVDVSALAPGSYTFRAANSDPSDGEGNRPDEDTRTIVVE